MGTTFEGKLPKLAMSLLVAIAVMLGLMSGAVVEKALANDAGASRLTVADMQVAAAAYPLWVGEDQVTSDNLEGQGWSFTPAANGNPATLTLNGYSYTGSGHVETLKDYDGDWDYLCHAAIFWKDDSPLVVELAGENSVAVIAETTDAETAKDSADKGEDASEDDEDEELYHRYHGIFCEGDLTLKGAGGLTAHGGDMQNGIAGIYAKGDVNIEAGMISAASYTSGISSYEGTIAIGKNAGVVTADATGGSTASFAIEAEGYDVRIDGGTVTAKGYRGISAENNIVINGGKVLAQCTAAVQSIVSTSAIISEGGTLTVNGGEVTAKGYQYGIYVEHFIEEDETELADGIIINGGSVIAESASDDDSGIGISDCNMTVKGGSVRAVATGGEAFGVSYVDSYAVLHGGSLVIEEGIESFIAQGPAGAISSNIEVKNAVPGLGYADVDGTKGETAIAVNAKGQVLDSYKRVLFPAPADPVPVDPAADAPAPAKPAATKAASKSSPAKTGDAVEFALPASAALVAISAFALMLAARRRIR